MRILHRLREKVTATLDLIYCYNASETCTLTHGTCNPVKSMIWVWISCSTERRKPLADVCEMARLRARLYARE